jgi:hypothetical protein
METPSIEDRIHFIESPTADDLFAEARYGARREGYALVSVLRLAGIPVEYSLVVNEASLVERILDLADRPLAMGHYVGGELVDQGLYPPQVHISAPGNKAGITLTDGTLVSWQRLAEILDLFNQVKGYVGPEGARRGMIQLHLSRCRGSDAREMFLPNKPAPVYVVIGSEFEVSWSESVTAWITYYHLSLTKELSAEDALELMNLAAGEAYLYKMYE